MRCSIAGTIRWNDSTEARTLSWASITPFGVPVVPEVKTSSKSSSGRAAARPRAGRSQSGWEGLVRIGAQGVHRGRREAIEPGFARIRRITAGTEDEVARLGRLDDPFDRVGRHAQVERHDDQPGAHRAEVGGGQLRRRGRPGQHAIARLEAERPQAPGGQARTPIQLAEGPGRRRPVVAPKAQRRPIAVSGDGFLEQVDQRAGHGVSVPRDGGCGGSNAAPVAVALFQAAKYLPGKATAASSADGSGAPWPRVPGLADSKTLAPGRPGGLGRRVAAAHLQDRDRTDRHRHSGDTPGGGHRSGCVDGRSRTVARRRTGSIARCRTRRTCRATGRAPRRTWLRDGGRSILCHSRRARLHRRAGARAVERDRPRR